MIGESDEVLKENLKCPSVQEMIKEFLDRYTYALLKFHNVDYDIDLIEGFISNRTRLLNSVLDTYMKYGALNNE